MGILVQPRFLGRCSENPLRSLVSAGVCNTCSFCLHVAAHFLYWHCLSYPTAGGWTHSPASGVLSLMVLWRLPCYLMACVFPLCPLFLWWHFLHPHMEEPIQAGLRRVVFMAGIALLRYGLWLREIERVWEKGGNDPVIAGELGHSILVTCLTPGRKPVARLWTASKMCSGSDLQSQEQLSL